MPTDPYEADSPRLVLNQNQLVMKHRSLKSANDQIHRISANYPNHRLSQVATKVYFELCNKIADIIGIRKIADNVNGEESWYYDWNEYYSNWNTEVLF